MTPDSRYQQQYLNNTGDWHVSDSPWKARIVYHLYRKNELYPQSVAETGCGAGVVLKELLKLDEGINTATGFDVSIVATELAKKLENHRLSFKHGNLPETHFADLLLMLDVMEHVEDYYAFLRNLKKHAKHFVFHIPLDLSCRSLLQPHILRQQRQSVGHLHYFSEEMVWWLLKDTGYAVIDFRFTKPVIDTAPAKGFKPVIKKNLRNLSYSLHPSLSSKLWGGYSLLILAKPAYAE